MNAFVMEWLESEKGWGTRPDGYSLHPTKEACEQYIRNYWLTMPNEVPDEYSRPVWDLPKEITISNPKLVEELGNGHNVRVWEHHAAKMEIRQALSH
jgi:hypothetical protein